MSRDPDRPSVAAAFAYADEVGRDADRWTAGNPTVYGSWISDEPTDSVGLREYEGGVNVPVRLPGERRALREEEVASQRVAQLTADLRRLEVAGRLRDAFWTLRHADVLLEQAEHEVEHLQMLDDFVARRVASGDAAPLDRDLTALELAGVRSQFATARGEHAAALQQWQVLTGCREAPPVFDDDAEVAADTPTENPLDHPALALAEAQRDEAAASADVAAARRGQPPTVGLMMRRERGAAATPWIDSVGVNVTVPFGRSGYRIRARAEAQRDLADAQAQAARVARDLARDRATAQARLQAAREAADAAAARLAHAQAALTRAEAAHEAGAWSTAELLRMRALTAEARLGEARARIALGRARSRVNQLAGVTP